jgi:hypothetical protein
LGLGSWADKIALLIACGVAILAVIGYAELVTVSRPPAGPADRVASLPPLAAAVAPSGETAKNDAAKIETPGLISPQADAFQEESSAPPDSSAPLWPLKKVPLPPIQESPGLEATAPLPPIRPPAFSNPMSPVPRQPRTASLLASGYDKWTAVYDITGRSVYLPDGTRLEAHSGLGELLDDPGHVSERDRGATPPHLYELELREGLFHGVQALRLTPIGDGEMFGRIGLLAHPYMLGPKGDSNGCVSFRDYDAFLRAYQAGQVKRLAVFARLD